MKVQINTLGIDDISQVLAIEKLAYPLPWSENMLLTSLAKDCVWGVFLDKELVGYAIVSIVIDEAHLLNICVSPSYSNRGLGRHLLRFVIQKMIERRCAMMFLEVRVSNQSAIALYFDEGFNEVGVRPNYYPAVGGGKEDAMLMTLELTVCAKV